MVVMRKGWRRSLVSWFRDLKFENKLIIMVLFLSLVPLVGYAVFSLNSFRQSSIKSAELDLEHVVKKLILLCEAQEALDRLKKGGPPEDVDSVTGASPAWKEGDEFKSLRSIIKDIVVAETGYCYVFDSSGFIVIHPYLENRNFFEMDEATSRYFVKMRDTAVNLPMGIVETIRYPWVDRDSGKTKLKLGKFGYFKPYDWIIVAASNEEEILKPYYQGRKLFYSVIFGTTLVVILLVFGVARYMMRPIKQLTEASIRIAQGDFSAELPSGSRDEIGTMARSFKIMIQRLQEAHHDLLEWSKMLEQKVEERTQALEKAHERMLISEKMASLGKLSAVVAHEINNPLSGVLNYLKLTLKLIRNDPSSVENLESIARYLELSASEVKRCGEIVRNLLTFAKRSYGEFTEEHLNGIVEKSIALIKHTLEVSEMELVKELDSSNNDLILCDVGGVQQMMVNLMVNAIEAMERGGKLTIRTDCSSGEEVRIVVSDTGKGIPESALPHLFEPFFTTKDSERGTGLGLSVVYGVVRAHGGTIDVKSKVDEGTAFTIRLPRRPPDKPKAEAGGEGAPGGEGKEGG